MNTLPLQNPEYQQMAWGMQAGYLPASKEDIAKVVGDSYTPTPAPPKGSEGKLENPEFVEYREYARSLGYNVSNLR